MRQKIRYDCKDNDNHLVFYFENGRLDEIHVGDVPGKSWMVIDFRERHVSSPGRCRRLHGRTGKMITLELLWV